MLSSSRVSPVRISNNLGTFGERFPRDHQGIYNQYYTKLLNHFEKLIADIHKSAGGKLAFPIGTEWIEKYLTGFEIRYIGFDNIKLECGGIEGCWEFDDREAGVINIFYNNNTIPVRQHFTKIHETVHVCQVLDSDFCELIDEIVLNDVLPPPMVEKLVERITDKTTAMYLMPKEIIVKKYQENKNVFELARAFRVSARTAMYRLSECGIMIPN